MGDVFCRMAASWGSNACRVVAIIREVRGAMVTTKRDPLERSPSPWLVVREAADRARQSVVPETRNDDQINDANPTRRVG